MSLLTSPGAQRAAAAVRALADRGTWMPGQEPGTVMTTALYAAAAYHAGPGRQALIDALTAKTGYHGVALTPDLADRVVTALMGQPVQMRLVCSHCAKPMMSASERCNGSFVDTGHPLNVEPVEIPA